MRGRKQEFSLLVSPSLILHSCDASGFIPRFLAATVQCNVYTYSLMCAFPHYITCIIVYILIEHQRMQEVERGIPMLRILLADDHTLIRRIVREILQRAGDMEVVAEASTGQEAEAQAAQTHPDVVLMDLDMPDCDGFEATERVLACSPESRVVILTASQQEHLALLAIQRGAIGYLTKDIEPETLIAAIRSAARNEISIPGPLATRVLAHLRTLTLSGKLREVAEGETSYSHAASSRTFYYRLQSRLNGSSVNIQNLSRPLTEREIEVLDLIRKGRKNREIAQELNIAESTVHKHIQNIFEKLHARSRTEAIYLLNSRT